VAPRSTKALAVEGKVNEGMITSSPGPTSASSADISKAPVQEWVSSTRAEPHRSSSHCEQRCVIAPLPDSWPCSSASATYPNSVPTV